jgi:hypothetical protein
MIIKKGAFSRLSLSLFVCLSLYSWPSLEAQVAVDFSGVWQQDVSRSVPPGKSKRSRELKIQQTGGTLTVKVTSKNGESVRTLDLNYEIGGQELIYKGLDGDEFHTKVHRDGESLVFDTIEHERGRQIVEKQIWTLAEHGKILREVKQVQEAGGPKESVTVYEKSSSVPVE